MERTYNVNHDLAGKRAECEGGMPVAGPPGGPDLLGSREYFRGRLSGLYFDEGDPPWRWYELVGLESRPEDWTGDVVWCEEGFLFLMDE